MTKYRKLIAPIEGHRIDIDLDGSLKVPDDPIIPYIEGDGVGIDITPVMRKVVDAAVAKAYGGKRRIQWLEIFAGEKALPIYGPDEWLPEDTLAAIRDYRVAIKGPLSTPISGGMRSINVALRMKLDLYTCIRPVHYFPGVPSPMKHPERLDVVIFRENTEDLYAGIEWRAGTPGARAIIELVNATPHEGKHIADLDGTAIGIKPISIGCSKRLIRRAIRYAIARGLPSVTLVHKGNIQKFTEGGFKDWGYELAREEFAETTVAGWDPVPGKIVIKDVITDSMFQQLLLRPDEYSVIATTNLNGDYLSDACAAQVGGLGMAPGANIGDEAAIFEATHGTAPKYAGQDKVNPGSLILSAALMLEHLGWMEAAKRITSGMTGAISRGFVTYDLARLMEGSTLVSCSRFGEAIVESMNQAVLP